MCTLLTAPPAGYGGRMRVVFIFIILLVLLGLAVPVTFAVQLWMDGQSIIARAEQGGALRGASAERLTQVERTIAMAEFRETWRSRAIPCRTLATLWADITTDTAPQSLPVSHKFATSLLTERRETSIRWQMRRYIVSCQLEQRFDDRELLRLWLARVSFGRDDAVGLENAAQAIFGKPSRALNSEESARLAALLRAPSLRNQPERWAERARLIQERVAPPAQ
jgi:hypothetical protein